MKYLHLLRLPLAAMLLSCAVNSPAVLSPAASGSPEVLPEPRIISSKGAVGLAAAKPKAAATSSVAAKPAAAATKLVVAKPLDATLATPAVPKLAVVTPAALKDGIISGIRFGRFGEVAVYKPKAPTHAVLFLSGDGGWNQGVIEMAQVLYRKDYLVIGIDMRRYLAAVGKGKERCFYPPAELQGLAQVVQKRIGMRRYLRPILVGYSSGATLAYGALAAAPPGTFDGAISIGFCPDAVSQKPMCKGEGLSTRPHRTKAGGKSQGYDLLPYKQLPALWVALHGRSDQTCPYKQTETFVTAVGNARLVGLDMVGHGFGVQKRWQVPFERSIRDVTAAAFVRAPQINKEHTTGLSADAPVPSPLDRGDVDLPLVEIKPPLDAPLTDYLAILVSGDGGWAGLDRDIANSLADAGVPVIGLDSLQYFWSERTPENGASDLQLLLTYYLKDWHKQKAIVIGFSFGAEVLPFMVARLSPASKAKVPLVALVSPSKLATFEFEIAQLFGPSDTPSGQPVAPELAKLKDIRRLCIYGSSDHHALCPQLHDGTQVIKLPGGHRLGGSGEVIASAVLQAIGQPVAK